MRTQERNISQDSQYFVYSPSKNAQEMFLYPLQCGRFIYEPGYSLARESFDSFLLMYVENGSFTLETAGQSRNVKTGQLVLIDCYARHAYFSNTGWSCLWCHFDGITARKWYESITARVGNLFAMPDVQPVKGKLAAIYETFALGGVVREPLLSKYLTDILTAIVLYTPTDAAADARQSAVETAAAYISEHFPEKLTVEELAEMAGFSEYHFIRIFKAHTGFTPYEYLVNTRMNNARYLLKNSALPVKEVCFSTGFSSESSFCSTFKRIEGVTPAQYRASSTLRSPAL